MSSESDIDEAREILDGLSDKVTFVLLKRNGSDEVTSELGRWAAQIANLSSLVSCDRPITVDQGPAPCLRIETSSRQNLYYSAIPNGLEMPPLLRTIVRLASGRTSLREETVHYLKSLHEDVLVEILITESCPFCPAVVELAGQFAICSEHIKVHVIDIVRFPLANQGFQIRSVPMAIVNKRAQMAGALSQESLVDLMQKALRKESLIDLLASNLTTGNAEKTLEIIECENNPNLLVDLMGRPEFTVRLGAMVLIESLQEKSPGRVGSLVPGLLELLHSDMINVRGDVAYVLGKIGDRRAVEPLKKLLLEENQDLLDIAKEALSFLEGEYS